MESPDLNAIFPRLPPYEPPPRWIPREERPHHPDYNNDLRHFLPRSLLLRRNKASEALGFNVRGGKEHNCGIYVSKVMANSEADRLGLKEGDQVKEVTKLRMCYFIMDKPDCNTNSILMVNNVDFQNLDHSGAVKILKMNTIIEMLVGYFPYGYGRTYDKNRHQSSGSSQSPGYREDLPPMHQADHSWSSQGRVQ